MMLRWPEPLPDETLYSLLARVARVNGIIDGLSWCNGFAFRPTMSVMDCQVDLLALIRDNDGLPTGFSNRLVGMTSLGVSAHLAEKDQEVLAKAGLGQMGVGLANPDEGGLCRWKICPRCVESDVAQFGVAYWHRQHQLPASLVCATHGAILGQFEVKKVKAHEQFFLPQDLGDFPLAYPTPGQLGPMEKWLGLARLGMEALEDWGPPHRREDILRSFTVGMQQAGLMARSSAIRRQSLVDSFEQNLSEICTKDRFSRVDSVTGPDALLRGLEDSLACKPLSRLLLVYWLFGSWASFKERCQWETALSMNGDWCPPSQIDDSVLPNPLDTHRSVCLEYKASVDNPTRANFLRLHKRSHRWLLHYDRQWLDNELPLPRMLETQLDLFQ